MLESALQYAELGFPVFPCAPNQKRPLVANGLLEATTDVEQVERWWTDHPTANVAIRTDGLLVVDIDAIDQPGGNRWLADQPEKLIDLAAGALSLTPSGGRHYVFKAPAGRSFRNTASKLAPKVDTRADGGYILVAPSIVGGKPYTWPGEMRLDAPPASLPEPPAWLLAMLDGATGGLVSVRRDQSSPSNVIASGARNATLTSLAGTMRRVGMSQGEIEAALKRANAERCRPPLADKEVETIAWSIARCEPDRAATAAVEGVVEIAEGGPRDPGTFPERLLRVPGFIGDVIDFNLAGAYKPQPVLALAGALALLATLTGRKVTDDYATRTNLYCVGVAATGAGKDRARVVNKAILSGAGLGRMIGPESIGSSAGLVSVAELEPAILLQLDEIGRHLKTLGDNRQSHLYNIPTVLMRLFTSSACVYIGDAYADTKRIKTIEQPHVCIYGTTVPQSLYESLTTESLTDGFLSRTLIFEGDDPGRQPPRSIGTPPAIIEAAKWWGDFAPGGNLSREVPQPVVIPTSSEADSILQALDDLSERERKGLGDPLGPLWTRVGEKARKLALLWACSVDRLSPVVDEASAQWSADVTAFLTRRMVYLASCWIASSGYDSKVKRIMRIIESGGAEGVTKSAINNRSGMDAEERRKIVSDICDRGLAIEAVEHTATKPVTRYVAARFCLAAVE